MAVLGRLKHLAATYLTRALLKPVEIHDLFRKEGKHWLIGRRRVDQQELVALAEEADSLLESQIWELLVTELRFKAQQTMFEKAKTGDDLLFGKALLYELEQIRTFLETVRRL